MQLEPITIHPEASDVEQAAQLLANEYEVSRDVAHAALLGMLAELLASVLRDPVFYSSAPGTSGYWSDALEEATRQKHNHLGPWQHPEPGELSAPRMPVVSDAAQEAAQLLADGALVAGPPEMAAEVRGLLLEAGHRGELSIVRLSAVNWWLYDLAPAPAPAPPARVTCSICGSPTRGVHPELCPLCASGVPVV